MPARLILVVLSLAAVACTPRARRVPSDTGVAVRRLALAGPIAAREAEISALAWMGDTLVLVPQYPERFGGVLFALDKAAIVAHLEAASPPPLHPHTLRFEAAGLRDLSGYEGLEAIAFQGTRVFVTVETAPGGMRAFLAAGDVTDEGRTIRIDTKHLAPIEPPVALANMSHESLIVADTSLLALFEANGPKVNPRPVAHVFDLDLAPRPPVPFPALDFRVADATPLDADGRFWVSNVYYVGDTHLRADSTRSVEQLIELRWTGRRVEKTGAPPLVLRRLGDDVTRNWEGLARLEGRGFLLATDRYPETMLGFVPYP